MSGKGKGGKRGGKKTTGGVHGYETSGVQGALAFMDAHGGDYAGGRDVLATGQG